MNKRHDYARLEREFITSQISLRELCRRHNITSHSVVVDQAKISVLSASILASALGAALLVRAKRPTTDLGPITFDELDATQPDSYLATTGVSGPSSGAAEAATKTAPSAH